MIQLDAPSPFTATPVSTTQIDLVWGNVLNESSYLIKFNTINDLGTASILTLPTANSTSYSHTGLTGGTTYYYWISAVGDGVNYGDSPWATTNATAAAGSTAFLAEWGWSVSALYSFIDGGGSPTVAGSATFASGSTVIVPTATMPQGSYLFVRMPSSQADKTAWFNTGLNYGNMPDSVFYDKLVEGAYDYYISRTPYYHDPSTPTTFS